jgi:branched-chain amino acid transport system permease protein
MTVIAFTVPADLGELFMNPWQRWRDKDFRGSGSSLALILIIIACTVPLWIEPYVELELTLAFGYCVACLGLNLLTGYTGQVSLGQSFFFATGAYFTAWLVVTEHVQYLVALPIAVVLTFVVGLVLAIPVVRLRGFNLGLVTLGLGLASTPLAQRLTGLTGGNIGLEMPTLTAVINPAWSFGGFLYYAALILLVAAVVLMLLLVRGQVGRSMTAVRDHEDAAAAVGVWPSWVKARSFALSAGLAGAGGWVYALAVGYVVPTSFPFLLSVYLLAGIVVGGAGSILGSIIGGMIVEFVPPLTSSINQGASGLVLGAVLVLAVVFVRQGIVGTAKAGLDRLVGFDAGRPSRGAGEFTEDKSAKTLEVP